MTPQSIHEEDFPKGHPKRFDYDPNSPEAKEWARKNVNLKGERDFPVGHPKAVDTPGNKNHIPVTIGVDPAHPELEAFTGATPAQAAGRKAAEQALAKLQIETPMLPEGFVDTAKVAEKAALDFLETQGHTPEEAAAILAEQGIDKVMAAKATLGVKG